MKFCKSLRATLRGSLVALIAAAAAAVVVVVLIIACSCEIGSCEVGIMEIPMEMFLQDILSGT